jgi:hypothetical protein
MTSPETHTRDRYRPPQAPVSDSAPFIPRVNVWDVIIVLSLSTMWLLNFPHHGISAFIGQHFPWPVERSLKWPAVLLERSLIEVGICIPAAIVLALRLRRFAVVIAMFLSAVFCARVAFDIPKTLPGSGVWRFLFLIAVMHTTLLVGATAYFAYLARRARAIG